MEAPSYTVLPGKKVRMLRELFFKESRSKFASRCFMTEAGLKNIESGCRCLHKGPPMLVITSMIEAATATAGDQITAAIIGDGLRRLFMSPAITEADIEELLEYLKTLKAK